MTINYDNNHISNLNSFSNISNIIQLYYIIDSHLYCTYNNIKNIIHLLQNKSYIINTLSLILLNKLFQNNKNIKIIKIILNKDLKNLLNNYINNIYNNFKISQFNRKLFINLFKFKKKLNNL